MSKEITNRDILKSAEILKNYCESFGNSCKGCIINETTDCCSNFYDLNTDSLKSYIEELDTNKENTEENKTEILNDTDNTNSKTYEDGLDDMWEYIKKLLLNISLDDLNNMFNVRNYTYIFKNYNSSKVIEKIKEWEKSQFQVGDEIISTISNTKGVITFMYGFDNMVCILWEDGSCEETTEVDNLKKTGRNLKQELDNMKNILINEGENK